MINGRRGKGVESQAKPNPIEGAKKNGEILLRNKLLVIDKI
jgi:hypothetical protein